MARALRAFPVLLLLLAAGCSDISMFAPSAQSDVRVEVRSLNQGGLVKPGQSLAFIVHSDLESARDLQLEIVLTDSQGKGVWSRTLSSPLVNEELQLVLPELATGQYTVQFRVVGADPGTQEQKLTFFYVEGDYAITGLTSYPPSTFPGAEITVRAEVRVPAKADPYVRWTQGTNLLARGRLSEGLDRIVWKAPREQGVYPVTVELFPIPPASSSDFSFSSPLSMTARLFITASPSRAADSLVPEASYYALFHFDGSLEVAGWVAGDTAPGQARAAAEAFGGASYAAEGPAGGYRVGSGAGIRFPALILPSTGGAASGGGQGAAKERAAGSGRALAPFTLTLLLVPDEKPRDTALLDVRAREAAKSVLSVIFDARGSLRATLASATGPIELPSGIAALEQGRLQRVDLSVYPQEDSLTALWFLDGRQTAAVVRSAVPAEMPADAVAVIGGGAGPLGVIAELGVYFQDEQGRRTIDPAVYRAAAQKRLGRGLILAEGFDGFLIPAGFSYRGQVAWDRGAISLGAGSRLDTPLFEAVLPEIVLELEARSSFPAESRIVMYWEGAEEGFAELRGDGTVLDPADPGGSVALPALPSPLVLRLSGDALVLSSAPAAGDATSGGSTAAGSGEPLRLPLRGAPGGSRWLKLSVAVTPAAGGTSLELDRILVYRPSNP